MKKITGAASGIIILVSAVLYSADKDVQAMEFVKNIIAKTKLEYGFTAALRYYQYTATTAKENPYSYVLEADSEDVLGEAQMTKADKGKYIAVLKDRSGVRISKLWKANKKEIFTLLSKEQYDKTIGYYVKNLITFHDSKDYKKNINALKKKSPKLNTSTLDKAGEITQWENYKELAFWYRRSVEKNEKVVYDILKELEENYR